jgi:hypothetical protein
MHGRAEDLAGELESLACRGGDWREGLDEGLRRAARLYPALADLAPLPVDVDREALVRWLLEALERTPPAPSVDELRLELERREWHGRLDGWELGLTAFARGRRAAWTPAEPRAGSAVLERLARAGGRAGPERDALEALGSLHAALFLAHAGGRIDPELLLGGRSGRSFAVTRPGGRVWRVGSQGAQGWTAPAAGRASPRARRRR